MSSAQSLASGDDNGKASDRIRFTMSNAKDTAHRLRATTSATINVSSILTTTERVWHDPFIIVL